MEGFFSLVLHSFHTISKILNIVYRYIKSSIFGVFLLFGRQILCSETWRAGLYGYCPVKTLIQRYLDKPLPSFWTIQFKTHIEHFVLKSPSGLYIHSILISAGGNPYFKVLTATLILYIYNNQCKWIYAQILDVVVIFLCPSMFTIYWHPSKLLQRFSMFNHFRLFK